MACISPQMPGFNPTPVHVGFLVEKVAMAHDFTKNFSFPSSNLPSLFQPHISSIPHQYYISLATGSSVEQKHLSFSLFLMTAE
jgi:hypothetical protein